MRTCSVAETLKTINKKCNRCNAGYISLIAFVYKYYAPQNHIFFLCDLHIFILRCVFDIEPPGGNKKKTG